MEASRVIGPYRIERLLGKGGMGEVYAAEDVENGRVVALKVLGHQLGDERERARFLREGRLAASISHPNVVYIFGSAEIDGTPLIAMELLAGGSLKDRIEQRGGMSPSQAVDAILDVIAGLDAAHAVGVLHRDIKPGNCFVDQDGRVKIGDFGLSISTTAREESRLTTTGAFHGTPAFASPEQLWGQPLDVRSDIYGVGATLHYLLTGRPPFEDNNLMALLKRVESEAPPSVRSLAPAVPRGLASVIRRCLAKAPADRFADYGELRDALAPYRAAAPTPVDAGRRVVAYVVDSVLLAVVASPIQAAMSIAGSFPPAASLLRDVLVGTVYFGLSEGLLGASLGKAALRLRVVGPDGARPGLVRAAIRAMVFHVFASLYHLPSLLEGGSGIGALILGLVAPLLAFVPARRANAFAGIHDLFTGSRVMRARESSDSRAAAPPACNPPEVAWTVPVGPYVVERAVEQPLVTPVVVAGYDRGLARRVWIRHLPRGATAVPESRRGLSATGRLRWLAGRRSPNECWDAFDAPEGESLLASTRACSWGTVRQWLCDLASTLERERDQGTLPSLTLDHVWIADDGRAWLLDWPVHEMTQSSVAAGGSEGLAPGRFLAAVCAAGTKGSYPLPLSAAQAIRDLRSHRAEGADRVARLGDALAGPSRVTRMTRAVHIACVAAFPILIQASAVVFSFSIPLTARRDPDAFRLALFLARVEDLQQSARMPAARAEREALQVYVGAHLMGVLDRAADRGTGSAQGLVSRDAALRHRAELSERTPPTLADIATAERLVAPFVARTEVELARQSDLRAAVPRGVSFNAMLFLAGVGVVAAAHRGGGFVFRRLALALVSLDGTLASPARAALRSVIAWAPALGAAYTVPLALGPEQSAVSRLLCSIVALAAVGLWIGGVTIAMRNPARGLQDRLVGTWIVPR